MSIAGLRYLEALAIPACDDSGMEGLRIVEADGMAGATVDARGARMGSGLSTYHDGVVSAANALAQGCGVRVSMRAAEAALLLLRRPE